MTRVVNPGALQPGGALALLPEIGEEREILKALSKDIHHLMPRHASDIMSAVVDPS